MQRENNFAPENILARLKRETEKAHRETEKQISLENPEFSVADYLDLLVKFYVFYQAFEPQLLSTIKERKIDFDYEARQKTSKLLNDLRILGMNEKAISELSGSRRDDLPALDSAEKIFGALYVVEGSTLGGQVISRFLQTKFGFNQTSGAAFFSGYGAQTGKMWNDFRAAILNFADSSAKHDEIIDAASETFAKFGRALGKN